MAYVTIVGQLICGPAAGLSIPLSNIMPLDIDRPEAISVPLQGDSMAHYDFDRDMMAVQLTNDGYLVHLGFVYRSEDN